MSESPATSDVPTRRWRRWVVLLILLGLLALLAASVYWLSRPDHATGLLLDRLGKSLGLEITASGANQYRLRGTPTLVLRDVIAREPGASTPLLRANKLVLTLPWSTLRARGSDLTARRIELKSATLDLPALQHWLATRPPSKTRIPILTEGLRVRDGTIVGGGWRMAGLQIDAPSLHPDRLLRMRLRGRYVTASLTAPVDLAIAISRPGDLADGKVSGVAGNGRATISQGNWKLSAAVALSGPVRLGDTLAITPLRLGLAGSYESADVRVPFALGVHGPLKFADSTWSLAPAGVALNGRNAGAQDNPVPTLHARGGLAFGDRLGLQLDGVIARWPEAWPALPPPIGQSTSPLPFSLRYAGSADFSEPTTVQLQRDATRLDARFRLPLVLDWLKASAAGSPLPPLDGTLVTPKLEISGATLEKVNIEFSDEPESPSPPVAAPSP